MPNPYVQLILGGALTIWVLFQLFAPGEAQNPVVVAMEWFGAIGGTLGVIMAIAQIVAGMRPGVQGKKP